MRPTEEDARARRETRRRIRRLRREFAGPERTAAENALRAHLKALPAFRAARRVGTFVAFDGEPDLGSLAAAPGRKRFFVPILRPDGMRFALLRPRPKWRKNFFGILEPVKPVFVDPRNLDLILTPLVAFDDRGVRLGVGRGYYDRCFKFLRLREKWLRPKLLGVAFSFQQVPNFDGYEWDIPLWGVVTEQGARVFAAGAD